MKALELKIPPLPLALGFGVLMWAIDRWSPRADRSVRALAHLQSAARQPSLRCFYRHFAQRSDLIGAVYRSQVDECADAAAKPAGRLTSVRQPITLVSRDPLGGGLHLRHWFLARRSRVVRLDSPQWSKTSAQQ